MSIKIKSRCLVSEKVSIKESEGLKWESKQIVLGVPDLMKTIYLDYY